MSMAVSLVVDGSAVSADPADLRALIVRHELDIGAFSG